MKCVLFKQSQSYPINSLLAPESSAHSRDVFRDFQSIPYPSTYTYSFWAFKPVYAEVFRPVSGNVDHGRTRQRQVQKSVPKIVKKLSQKNYKKSVKWCSKKVPQKSLPKCQKYIKCVPENVKKKEVGEWSGWKKCVKEVKQARKPRSYASSKLWLTHSLTHFTDRGKV